MKKSSVLILCTISVLLIAAIFFVGSSKKTPSMSIADGANVHMEGSTQIIEIKAEGGYFPERSVAKAGIPTVLRFSTGGAFDCSSSIRIPSLNMSKILPRNGSEDIALGTPEVGPLQGMCGMGMYPFSIEFKS